MIAPDTTVTFGLLDRCAAFVPRQRVESLLHPNRPTPADGVALIADISGFTPLTEALARGLSADQGAEELTRALNSVFTPLIDQIHAYRGSVLKFAGDALLVWFGRERGLSRADVVRRAVTSAMQLQRAIAIHGWIDTPIGAISLQMKVGLSYGPVKRLRLGGAELGFEDTLVGATLDRMAEAEHHASPGDVVCDAATLALLPPDAVEVAELADGFAAIRAVVRPIRPNPWPPLRWPAGEAAALLVTLQSYIPRQIYETLIIGHEQVAELKPVVSLFVQFHGLDYDGDGAVADKLQAWFAAVQQVAARYGGRLNRLITGDKGSLLHIIFGAPRAVEEQEARAVACALDVQQESARLPFITMHRIGIASGRVFAGPLGSPSRHDYTTMGDAINLSARLMQNAAPHQILMDASVQARLGADFEAADLGAIRVKGKAEPVRVFAALGRRAEGVDVQPSAQRLVPLVGRASEMAAIERRLVATKEGRGGIVTLVGEVGMGKSLILNTLHARHGAGVTWADGIGLAYGQTLSGYLFIAILRDLLRLPPGSGPDVANARLADFCADLFGAERLDATYPYLARFMGLPVSGEAARRVEGLSGENLRWQIFAAFIEMLQRLAARGPLVLAIEDLQWADNTSLQLLEVVLPRVADAAVLFIITMRPERDHAAWALRQRLDEQMPDALTDLVLSTLDAQASARLVTQLAPNLPERIVGHLVAKGGGNPLFLTELVHTLQAQGVLADEERLDSLALDALDLPDSVQGLLLAQIDRLAVEARHTLQMAAVIGAEFLHRVLQAIAAGEERVVADSLATLQAGDYVLPGKVGELGPSYLFRHALIQESAYGTLLYERRRAYHRDVAHALQRLFPIQMGEQSGILAYHYERADDMEQAIYYHLHTADQARLLYAHDEAESLYRKVLQLMEEQERGGGQPDEERRARIYLKIAQVRANMLDFEGAQAYYEQAFALLERIEHAQPPAPDGGRKRIFRAGVTEQGPPTLDPGLCQYSDVNVITYDLFEGLVELDAELNVLPAVARRWHVDEGGRRYRFELQPNLRWSDGQPLTAHDFVFAWRRNLHPETNAPAANFLYVIAGAEAFHHGETADPEALRVRALDDRHLEVMLNVPSSFFPYLLADTIAAPQPAHVALAKGAAWAEPAHMVGNGPFRVAAWRAGEEIRLERNPYYRGHQAGNLDEVSLRFVTPELHEYEQGLIDWCRVEDVADIPARYPHESFGMQPLVSFFLGMVCAGTPLASVPLRKALAASVDRRELVRRDSNDMQRPAFGGVVPPGMPGHSPEVGLAFDPVAAQAWLREAASVMGDIPPLTLAAPIGFHTVPHVLQEGWAQHLGLRIAVLEGLGWDEMLEAIGSGAAQLALLGYEADYPDPEGILRHYFHSGAPIYHHYFRWRSARFDHLVERASRETTARTRHVLFHEADRVLVADEAAIIPLYYRRMQGVLRAGFRLRDGGKIVRGNTLRFKHIVAD